MSDLFRGDGYCGEATFGDLARERAQREAARQAKEEKRREYEEYRRPIIFFNRKSDAIAWSDSYEAWASAIEADAHEFFEGQLPADYESRARDFYDMEKDRLRRLAEIDRMPKHKKIRPQYDRWGNPLYYSGE